MVEKEKRGLAASADTAPFFLFSNQSTSPAILRANPVHPFIGRILIRNPVHPLI
jgi:hypothetical protein